MADKRLRDEHEEDSEEREAQELQDAEIDSWGKDLIGNDAGEWWAPFL